MLFTATIEGSLITMPWPRANTQVFAVPRSIARSLENKDIAPRNTPASSELQKVASIQLPTHEQAPFRRNQRRFRAGRLAELHSAAHRGAVRRTAPTEV